MEHKKKITVKQKQKQYRALQYSCIGGEFASILAPFITLGIVYHDEWFPDPTSSFKVGLGGALGMALMGLAVWLVTKKKEKELNVTNGWITLIVGWFAVAFIFFLFQSLLNQMFEIMLWGGLGLLGAFGFDIGSKNAKTKAELYKEAINKYTKDTLVDDIKNEVLREQEEKAKNKDNGTTI